MCEQSPEWHRKHPIYYNAAEMEETPEVLIERIRQDLTNLRGKLTDIQFGYGWRDRLELGEAASLL